MRRTVSAFILLLASGLAGGPAIAGEAAPWTVRLDRPAAYDGDTLSIVVPGLPAPLQRISVRVLGVDTPEIAGKCPAEKAMAIVARDLVRALFAGAETVTVNVVKWDKYGGRIDAVVFTPAGDDLATVLIDRGLGRPYDGGPRSGWCGARAAD